MSTTTGGWSELLAKPVAVPTYLKNDWARDWGSLERYEQYYPNAVPADLQTGETTRSGFYEDGKLRVFEK